MKVVRAIPVLVVLGVFVAMPLFAGENPPLTSGGEEEVQLRADSLNVRLVGRWANATAYSIAIDEARHAAFIGSGGKVYVIGIENPANPVLLGEVAIGGMAKDLHYENGHLYVADLTDGLRIVSVADLGNPAVVGYFDTQSYVWGLTVADSHAFLACGGNGLIVVSVETPSAPVEVGRCPISGYVTSVDIQDSLLAVADNVGVMRLLSVKDPANPREIGSCASPGTPWGIAIFDQEVFVAAGGAGLRVMSVTDPHDPLEVGFSDTPGYARNVMIEWPYAYLASGASGLRIISIADTSALVELGFYDSDGYTWDVASSDSLLYVADGDGGMLILELTQPVSVDGPGDTGAPAPRALSLAQNYPNPFNPVTTIGFTVPGQNETRVVLLIHNIRGRLVRILIDEALSPGERTVVWDGRNERGEKVPSGVYLYTLRSGGSVVSRKMTVIE
jgi:hypothetical protein